MPSFHEQCSYTVIEMMRHGLPIIGTNAIGLGEMLEATPNLRVSINGDDFDEEDFISQIALRLDLLLSDDTAYQKASEAVSRQYKERYTVTAMMQGVHEAALALHVNYRSPVSLDYLPHMDNQMVALINKQPDIDTDFYGISGMGVYLWWRVLQQETGDAVDTDNLDMIKEHLIYYLDWVGEVAESEPFPVELYETLVSMREHSFYPTKVEKLLRLGKVTGKSTHFPSDQEILHNALKICACKI